MPNDPNLNESREATVESVAAALDHLELVNIFFVNIAASLEGPPDTVATLKSDIVNSFLAQPGVFSNRFDWSVQMLQAAVEDEEPELVADIKLTIQVDYDCSDGYTVSEVDANAISRTTGLFSAYPYARQAIQDISARLQIDQTVLGMLARGEVGPAGITTVSTKETVHYSMKNDS